MKLFEKSSFGRITDLETTISKYYEQILQNNNYVLRSSEKQTINMQNWKGTEHRLRE